jgi:hypothetical protein
MAAKGRSHSPSGGRRHMRPAPTPSADTFESVPSTHEYGAAQNRGYWAFGLPPTSWCYRLQLEPPACSALTLGIIGTSSAISGDKGATACGALMSGTVTIPVAASRGALLGVPAGISARPLGPRIPGISESSSATPMSDLWPLNYRSSAEQIFTGLADLSGELEALLPLFRRRLPAVIWLEIAIWCLGAHHRSLYFRAPATHAGAELRRWLAGALRLPPVCGAFASFTPSEPCLGLETGLFAAVVTIELARPADGANFTVCLRGTSGVWPVLSFVWSASDPLRTTLSGQSSFRLPVSDFFTAQVEGGPSREWSILVIRTWPT